MPSRQGHSKSRHGCTRCKQRRVKCNELSPCQNCARRKEECSLYQDQGINIILSERAQFPLHSPSPIDSNFLSHLFPKSTQRRPDEATWGEDLFLMGHFTSSTAYTISSRTDVLQLWQTVIPEDAISCPFLVHGVLALSALHLASLRPSQREKYEHRCRRHQNEAIPEYRRAIQDIRPGIAGPVFAMASLVALLGLATISDNALPKEDMLSRHRPDLNDVKAIFTIVRGLEAVLKHGTVMWDTITNSRYRVAMTGHTAISGQVLELPVDVQLRYQQLMTDCLDSLLATDKSAKLACLDAIDSLQAIHGELLFLVSENGSEKEIELEPAYVVKWLALVPSEFVTLLQEENTAALIILGDFFALFRFLENRWFLKNVSTNALNAIQEAINPRGLIWLKGSEKQKTKLVRQNLAIS